MSGHPKLAQAWFQITEPSPSVFAIREPLHFEQVLSYLIVGADRAVLVDTGTGVGDFGTLVASLTDRPVLLINSHSHWDHVGGNRFFDDVAIHADELTRLEAGFSAEYMAKAFAPPALLGPLPAGLFPESLAIPPGHANSLVSAGDRFDLGGRVLEVMHTPGHSPGLLCFLDEANGILFSTDAAYPSHLYAYSDETDLEVYIESMRLLAALSDQLAMVHPSHDADHMEPALLPAMHDALVEIAKGRLPNELDEERATHRFDGFGVYAPPELHRQFR